MDHLRPPTVSDVLQQHATYGYVAVAGSHTALVLAEQGYEVTMLDNLSNSFLKVLDAIKKLAGDKADQLHFAQVLMH